MLGFVPQPNLLLFRYSYLVTDEKKDINRVLIAGTHSGVGKTTVTLGIMSLLRKKGFTVQGFKSGPDYIDVSHHNIVTGNRSRNLDTWMIDENGCRELFYRSAIKADISVIEGVMGLFDGSLTDEPKGSTAYLAKILRTPVILVIDVKGMAQSAGAVALGFVNYDEETCVKGIILNRVGSEKQFDAIKCSIERVAKVPVIGYLKRDNNIMIPERHLGLVPSVEGDGDDDLYERIGLQMASTLDIDKVVDIAADGGRFPEFESRLFSSSDFIVRRRKKSKGDDGKGSGQRRIKIAVAMDKAFHFYYQDNLDILEAKGAELCFFSPLYDRRLLDDIDGIYIGGGFPELFGPELEANEEMRCCIKDAADRGLVIYAECGGMMYLLDKLVDCKGISYIMCGVFPASSVMENRRQGLGYINVDGCVDNILCRKGDKFSAHEFHWSKIIDFAENKDLLFAYSVSKGLNGKVKPDGLVKNNVLASYAHVHFASNPLLAVNLLESMSVIRMHNLK